MDIVPNKKHDQLNCIDLRHVLILLYHTIYEKPTHLGICRTDVLHCQENCGQISETESSAAADRENKLSINLIIRTIQGFVGSEVGSNISIHRKIPEIFLLC